MVDPGTTDKGATESKNDSSLHASIIMPDVELASGDAVSIQMVLHNTGDQPASFLPMNTAFETPLYADVFEVKLMDELLPYIGPMASRLPATADDVLELKPDERLERTVVLSDYYPMDQPGRYEIRYIPRQLTVEPELAIELVELVLDTPAVYVNIH